MTAIQQQPPPPPQQQPASPAAGDAALAVATAAALASAVTVPAALALLARRFSPAGISRDVLQQALATVMAMPPERAGFFGPATATVARLNHMRNAQFVVAASRRLQANVAAASSRGTSRAQALADAAARERRYYGQHLLANWARDGAAAQVDSAAMTHGLLLGWHTVLDGRTSPECRAADRHNFRADQMPLIGYPGAVHPHCRCWPGAPFPGAALVGSPAKRAREHAYA